jgi:hypothetical protein
MSIKILLKTILYSITLILFIACSSSETTSGTVASLDDLSLSIIENTTSGTEVGAIVISNSGDSAITAISLTGTGSEKFTVSTDGTILLNIDVSLDYEETQAYHLSAIATNAAGNSSSATVDITITDYENPFLIAKIQASDANENANFARAVAVSGDYFVVGAYYSSDGNGSAYLYKKQLDGTVTQLAIIHSNDLEVFDTFGTSVSMSGTYIVVGAPGKDTPVQNAGSAYVFKRNSDDTVSQIAKIQADDASAFDFFGRSVSISGDYIVVGANEDDTAGDDNAGSAYVFKRNSDDTISQIAKIQSSDIEGGDKFGGSVSISGDYIVVGADKYDTAGSDTGSAYLFKRVSDTNVTQIAKLQADDASLSSYFGHSVSIDNDYIIIGAPYKNDDEGSAYLFKRNSDLNVTQIAKIKADDIVLGDLFGYSVAISGDYIAVGSRYGSLSGSAYLFKRNSDTLNDVTQVTKIEAHDPEEYDEFGAAIAVDSHNIIIGAPGVDTTFRGAGGAYIVDREALNQPYIYSTEPIILVDEQYSNTNVIFALEAASPSGSIDYTLSGDDADKFSVIDGNLSFAETADYENPMDTDQDNNYSITITASDSNNVMKSIDYTITLQDRSYFDLTKIEADDAESNDAFGSAVAVSGDYVLVGAHGEDTQGSNAGSAYLYKKQVNGSLTQIAKIQASDAEAGDVFGKAVSISGDYIIVGASQEDTDGSNAGSAYLFKRNSDAQNDVIFLAKLQADDASAFANFGSSVSIDGDYIIIGASQEDTNGLNAGSAYLFKRNDDNNISQLAKLTSSDIAAGDSFGTSVSIDGDYVVIGAPNSNTNGTNAGSTYIFKINSDSDITQIAKIQSSDIASGDKFGGSVSISGDYIVVGAVGEATYGELSGSAYVFKRNSDSDVSQIAKVQSDDILTKDNFGNSVSMKGDYIVVGAFRADNGNIGSNEGSAYIFKRNSDSNITQITKIQAHDADTSDNFGNAVAISDQVIVVGAKQEDTTAIFLDNAGSVYSYIKDANQP